MTQGKKSERFDLLEKSPVITVPSGGTDLLVDSTSPPAPATRYDLRVLQSLRQIIRAIDQHSRQLLGEYNITGPQLISLLIIEEHEPVTATAIAGHIHISPSTVIGILDRLEAKGLIRRERDKKDRRLVQITLTDQGRGLIISAPSPLQGTLAEAMDKLPESELVTIVESFDRIVALMQIQHVDAAPILETGSINPTSGNTDV